MVVLAAHLLKGHVLAQDKPRLGPHASLIGRPSSSWVSLSILPALALCSKGHTWERRSDNPSFWLLADTCKILQTILSFGAACAEGC